jgi:5-(carboxyamino)imidazole ribonucleotide mutase
MPKKPNRLTDKKSRKNAPQSTPPKKPSQSLNPSQQKQGLARVGIIMGSASDWDTMKPAAELLAEFGIPYETRVVSAHRTPDLMFAYARSAGERGLQVIIAGAGGAAHLPGMVASLTPLPVIGVPVASKQLKGLDSLLSIVQMPAGIPVATVSIGNGRNAGLLAARILGALDLKIRAQVEAFQKNLESQVLDMQLPSL